MAAGLVQLGLVVSFERVVAIREGRVMAVVVACCLTTTAVHLLMEAATREHRQLRHVGRFQVYSWLSQDQFDPFLNTAGTSRLLIPHFSLLFLTKATVTCAKLRAEGSVSGSLMSRYQLARIFSGANGRLTCSAYTALAFMLFTVLVINPLLGDLGQPGDVIPPESFIMNTFFFWAGGASFLVNTEVAQFIFRRLRRCFIGTTLVFAPIFTLSGWLLERGGGEVGDVLPLPYPAQEQGVPGEVGGGEVGDVLPIQCPLQEQEEQGRVGRGEVGDVLPLLCPVQEQGEQGEVGGGKVLDVLPLRFPVQEQGPQNEEAGTSGRSDQNLAANLNFITVTYDVQKGTQVDSMPSICD